MIKTYFQIILIMCCVQLSIAQNLQLEHVSSYATGLFDEAAAEIVGYDPMTKSVFFTNANSNSVSVLDVTDIKNPTLITEISQAPYGSKKSCIFTTKVVEQA